MVKLTENEHRVAQALATTGATNKVIGRSLGLSAVQVNSALHNISQKWHTTTRTQLALLYAQHYLKTETFK